MMDSKKKRCGRFLAAVMAVLVGCGSVAAGVGSMLCFAMGMYQEKSKSEILTPIYQNIQKYYEVQIAAEGQECKDSKQWENTNLEYTVQKVPLGTKSTDEGVHVYDMGQNTHFEAHEGILWNLVHNTWYDYESSDYYDEQRITDLIYNSTNGVFYYSTSGEYYFPVKKIRLDKGYTMMDEKGNEIVGTWLNTFEYSTTDKCYYSGVWENGQKKEDAGETYILKTENYENWYGAKFDEIPVFMKRIVNAQLSSEGPRTVPNLIAYDMAFNPQDYYFDDYFTGSYQRYAVTFGKETENDGDYSYAKRSDNEGNVLVFNMPISLEVQYNDTRDTMQSWAVKSRIMLPLDENKSDLFVEATEVVDALYAMRTYLLLGALLGFFAFVVLVVVCCVFTYRLNRSDKKSQPGFWEKIPLELFWFVMGMGLIGCIAVAIELLIAWMQCMAGAINVFAGLCLLVVAVGIIIGLLLLINFFSRLRYGTMKKYTALYYVCRLFKKVMRGCKGVWMFVVETYYANTSQFMRVTAAWCIISLLQLIVLVWSLAINQVLVLFFFYKIVEFLFVLCLVMQLESLRRGSKRLAEDDISEKLDTSKLHGSFKEIAISLNQIKEGIQVAVQERLKSERFKTELITNVSHDIKTPLTSIINYVDLLGKPETTEEEKAQYLDVLERQSGKLKKLIEDLIEASKASTGNLSVYMQECDLGILLTQAVGEFSEKLVQNELQLVVKKEVEEVLVQADNRHLWRIFDNLLNNICKYAQPGTRVYIDMDVQENGVDIMFRNTSKYQLEINGEDVMERFVRGDKSRTMDGNGLGLSIANSLAELMNGTLKITIDGDLFKAVLHLPK